MLKIINKDVHLLCYETFFVKHKNNANHYIYIKCDVKNWFQNVKHKFNYSVPHTPNSLFTFYFHIR